MPKNAAKIAADDLAIFKNAREFVAYLRNGNGEKIVESRPTLAEATEVAEAIRAAHPGRDVLISAVESEGRQVPVTPALIAAAAKPAPKAAKPAKPKKAEKKAAKAPAKARKANGERQPGGKRAAILAAAQAGKLPAAPDFSAKTHERFRPRLAEVVALAKAGDLKGLKAFKINPISSSPKAIARYRDLSVIALQAKR